MRRGRETGKVWFMETPQLSNQLVLVFLGLPGLAENIPCPGNPSVLAKTACSVTLRYGQRFKFCDRQSETGRFMVP